MSTQKEIATYLGVSIATVSRALNDKPGISPEVRARVLKALRELNYAPSASARALATAQTHTIGYLDYAYSSALPPTLASYYPDNSLHRGLSEELKRCDYHVLTSYVDHEAVDKLEIPDMVLQRRVDGLILVGPAIRPRFILELRNLGVPVVLVDNFLSETPIDCILWDNEQGAYEVVKHLIDHGYEHIIFLSGPVQWLSSQERAAGYRRALQEAGLEPRVVVMSSTTFETGRQAILTDLTDHPEVTAVVAINDATATGVIQAYQQMGYHVPEDIAVVGFDDAAWARIYTPPLTTVRVPRYEMGVHAARRIVNLIEHKDRVPVQERLAVQLVIRQSCGCSATSS